MLFQTVQSYLRLIGKVCLQCFSSTDKHLRTNLKLCMIKKWKGIARFHGPHHFLFSDLSPRVCPYIPLYQVNVFSKLTCQILCNTLPKLTPPPPTCTPKLNASRTSMVFHSICSLSPQKETLHNFSILFFFFNHVKLSRQPHANMWSLHIKTSPHCAQNASFLTHLFLSDSKTKVHLNQTTHIHTGIQKNWAHAGTLHTTHKWKHSHSHQSFSTLQFSQAFSGNPLNYIWTNREEINIYLQHRTSNNIFSFIRRAHAKSIKPSIFLQAFRNLGKWF